MKVKYLYHSGVMVIIDEIRLVFDYYKDPDNVLEKNPTKYTYFFASHNHRDHFSKKIFQYHDENTHYILSDDVSTKENHPIDFIKPDSTITNQHMRIQTYPSNDEGVAFLINVKGKNIFYSGDLHWWYWEGEPQHENEELVKSFQQQVEKMKNMTLDVAFLVMDPRLDKQRYDGIEWFIDHVNVKKVYPIHFWDKWDAIEEMKEYVNKQTYRDKIDYYGR